MSLSSASVSKLKTIGELSSRVASSQMKASRSTALRKHAELKDLRKRSLNFHVFRTIYPIDTRIADLDRKKTTREKLSVCRTFRDLLDAFSPDKSGNIRLSEASYCDLMKLVRSHMRDIPLSIFPKVLNVMVENTGQTGDVTESIVSGIVKRLELAHATADCIEYTAGEWAGIGISLNRLIAVDKKPCFSLHAIIARELYSAMPKMETELMQDILRYLTGLSNRGRIHYKLFRSIESQVSDELQRVSSFLEFRKPVFSLTGVSHEGKKQMCGAPVQLLEIVSSLFEGLDRGFPRMHSRTLSGIDRFILFHKATLPHMQVMRLLCGVVACGFVPLPVSHEYIKEFFRKHRRLSLLPDGDILDVFRAMRLTGYRSVFGVGRVSKILRERGLTGTMNPGISIIRLLKNPNLLHHLDEGQIINLFPRLASRKNSRPVRKLIQKSLQLVRISRLSPESLQVLDSSHEILNGARRRELARALAFHIPEEFGV